MEVEATSLGHAAFAPHDYETPQAPSPSPLNSPWPELESDMARLEEGATQLEQRRSPALPQSQNDDNLRAKEVAQQSPRYDAPYAVPPTSDTQFLNPKPQAETLSQPPSNDVRKSPKPPAKPISLAQSLFPEDFEDDVEQQEEVPAAGEQADQAQPETLPQTQTQIEQQTLAPTQDALPDLADQSVLDKPVLVPSYSLPESIDPLDQSVDPLDQSRPLQPQTPPKDYSELANAVADLNLPTNSLFPADLALASYEAEEAAPVQDAQNDPMQAFAKLQFPDGDFYVNTYAVELGRDLNAAKFERKAGRKHKMKLNRDVQMEQDAEMNVDDEGRNIARSNVSESGGIVGVNIDYDSEENEEAKRRKRKQFRSTNSSHSVDPTSLLTNPYDLSLDWQPQQDKPFEYECPFIPIHPQAGQSFKNISRKHIRIEYNLQKAHWEMLVNGRNGVFHDDSHVDRGSLVKLHHGSEILIQGITIVFKLPDNARVEEEEEEPAHILSDTDSSLSDLDSVASLGFAHDDDDEIGLSSEDEPLRLKRPAQKKEPLSRIVKLRFKLKKNFPAVAGLPVEKDDKKEREQEREREKEKKREREKVKAEIREKIKEKEKEIEDEKEKEKAAEKAKAKEKDKEKDKEREKERRPSKSGKQSIKADRPTRAEKAEKMPRTPKLDKVDKVDKVEKTEKVEKPVQKLALPQKVETSVAVETPKPVEAAAKTIAMPTQPEILTPMFEERRESAVATTEMPPPSHPVDFKHSVEPDSYEALQALQVTPSQTPPAVPADLPPGSILAGLAPEEIPQKRKGPGRPPKNGVMSKRDEAIIKRKTKELQKMGKIVPPLAELLALARAEGGSTTKKDSKPEDGREGEHLSQSVEIDPALMAIQEHNNATPSIEVKSEGGIPAAQPTPDKDANKPKRIVKSPSPQKPESEYTEEELKKPTQTYVVLIHEALSKAPTGVMDLQQIYDAMQKMYPWFKYRSTTAGWQSSVRHNLISSEAFEEAGKIGKGRLWKINPNVSIDKEKKRKAPTPPPDNRPPQQQQQYPYYPNNQYPYGHPGAPAYGAYARPSPYGTPYGPPTVQNGSRPPVPTPQQKPGTYYSPYASTTPGAAAAGSPYGPPSRAPYAPYPQPPRPPGNTYGQLPQPPQSGQPPNQVPGQNQPQHPGQAPHPPSGQPYQAPGAPNGQPQYAPQGPQQPPRPVMAPGPGQAPPPNQSGITSEKMIDNIMDYHKKYLSNFQGPEQEKARTVFRKATNRHIHKGMDHGPYESEEEEKLYKAIDNIITTTQAETAAAATAQPQTNGQGPVQGVPPQGQAQAGAAQNAAGPAPQPQGTPAQNPPPPGQAHPPAPQQNMSAGPQSINGHHPIQHVSSSEQALADALKTAMPSAQAFRQGAPIAPYYPALPNHQGIAPRPSPYGQPQGPQQQRMQPPSGQQQATYARPTLAAAPPAPQVQAPRPTFTAPSQPQSTVTTPGAPTQVAPRPVAPAPSQSIQPSPVQAPGQAPQQHSGPVSGQANQQLPAPAPVTQPLPASQPLQPSVSSQTSTPAPSIQQQTPAPVSESAATTPASVATQAQAVPTQPPTLVAAATPPQASVAPTPPADPNAHGGLKRPIEIDDDGDRDAKKQKNDEQT
ncbi:hypothetical protein E4T47_02560 [Aureobasidium subglaciale]|nr:hypothetical protein E4T47_02560 [Aureobasidium subglaciale]